MNDETVDVKNHGRATVTYWEELARDIEIVQRLLSTDPELKDPTFLAINFEHLVDRLKRAVTPMAVAAMDSLLPSIKKLTDIISTIQALRQLEGNANTLTKKSILSSSKAVLDTISAQVNRLVMMSLPTHPAAFGIPDNVLVDSLREQTNDLSTRNRILLQDLSQLTKEKIALEEFAQRAAVEKKREIDQLEERLSSDFQKKIADKTNKYVEGALGALEANRSNFESTSHWWSVAAVTVFCLGIGLSVWLAFHGGAELIANPLMQWSLLAFYSVKGLILLGLLYAVVSYCSKQGRSYMHESLKSAERKHAISYGEFYLLAFGAGSANENVKEAFAHWNISTTSAFSSDANTRDTEPPQMKFLETLVDKLIDKAVAKS